MAAVLAVAVISAGSGCSDDNKQPDPTTSGVTTRLSQSFVRQADQICTDAHAELKRLGDHVTFDPTDPDPAREGLIRPGARIYERLAQGLRRLTAETTTTDEVATYVGYFEIIDAILTARLQVGEPGGPLKTDAQPLEARFEAVAADQADAASRAGLSACAFDVTETVFGR